MIFVAPLILAVVTTAPGLEVWAKPVTTPNLPPEGGSHVPSVVVPGFSRAQTPSSALAEARRLFEALDYERARPALDLAIAELEARPSEREIRDLLASAYEMRGRARFGLGDAAGTLADFKRLLAIQPGYRLPDQVSPRVVAIFDEARRTTVAFLVLKLEPADADFELDGIRVKPPPDPLPVVAGPHTITGAKAGYRPASQSVTVDPGTMQEISVALERVTATVALVTRPPGVAVTVDGVPRGTTLPGGAQVIDPNPNRTAGAPPETLSQPLVVMDLAPGPHLLALSRDCYIKQERRFVVERLTDYRLDPIELKPAVASIAVFANVEGATVSLDGDARGTAPLRLGDVCEGPHTIETRTLYGRFTQRFEARAGDTVTINASIKPAFAVVVVSGAPPALGSPSEVQAMLERTLASVGSLTVFAPPEEQLSAALKGNQLPAGWTGTGPDGRLFGEATRLTTQARIETGARIARLLGAQGLAALTFHREDTTTGQALLSLLAEGGGRPDVVLVDFARADAAARIAARLNSHIRIFEPSIGISAIDVADVSGAVVVKLDAAAGQTGLVPGDIIVAAGTQAIQSASELVAVVARAKPDESLTLEARGAGNAPKRVTLRIVAAPRVISLADQTLVSNALIPAFRQLVGRGGPDQAVARLNLAIALMRVESWALAQSELERVTLPAGPGISAGTVKYLLGLCHEALGHTAEAQAAFSEAAQADESLLWDDGPSVKELAERKLRKKGS